MTEVDSPQRTEGWRYPAGSPDAERQCWVARLLARLVDGWAGLPPASTPRVEVRRGLRVPMPDGVALLADRYRPCRADALPVVLLRTPYRRNNPMDWPLATALARRGIQVVVQSVRGTNGSGGRFRAFHQERADGLATVTWLRRRPWCDGRVATVGASYAGYAQWAVAPYADPPLSALAAAVSSARMPASLYPGGAVPLAGVLSWAVFLARQEQWRLPGLWPAPRQRRRTRRALGRLPISAADRAAVGAPVPFFQDVVTHAEGDGGYWTAADHGAAVARVAAPSSMLTGWYDPFLPGQLADFRAAATAGNPTRLTIGPWRHVDPRMLRAMLADQVELITGRLGTGRPAPPRAPVRAYLQHAGRWIDLPGWPPRGNPAAALHLHPGGRLHLAPPPPGPPDRFRYDPADPTPVVGGPLLDGPAGQRDNRRTEARPDVLCYTGPPLIEPLDVLGEVRAHLYVRAEPGHHDLFVRLCDVDGRGVSRNVCDGIARLRPDPAPGPRPVTVALFPTGYRFRRGHRIRLQLAGAAFPQYARNHGTGAAAAAAVRTRVVDIAVHHDPDHPSHLELPVLPGAR